MKMVCIGDILEPLPSEVRERVTRVLQQSESDTIKTAALKLILAEHKEVLEQNGWNSDYLAYALPFFVSEHLKQAAENN